MNLISFGNGASLFHWSKTSPLSGKNLGSNTNVMKKAKPHISKRLVA